MSRKIMISCAVTGSADSPGKNPAVPVTPQAIAASAIDAAKAGAAIVHIHVRDPKTTKPSMDLALYREVTERIRDSGVDVIINLTTGAGGRFAPGETNPREGGVGTTLSLPHERTRHVEALRPEICSLDMGSMNMGDQAFLNTPGHLRVMAKTIKEAGVLPELEVFEAGHVLLARRLIDEGLIRSPALFQICLGILWSQPASAEAMLYMRNLLPADSVWFAFGISLHQFPMAAQAILLGGHVRVGLEDNLYLARGNLAPSNAALVEKAASIINILGHDPATPAEAREMLDIGK
ncbi:3-keto-5-aminohexanoate cleavage protein [Microvirga massiliensis]|uniref:3-keto-5-aminohexanoate cleavage protein n=1 Tax=Microvirga massiliensis TaxID=1033741 RepID=UPI00062BB2CA|nr:3-keto-5-aminohexanoate cleavage protein [Microvirga massiliensis]